MRRYSKGAVVQQRGRWRVFWYEDGIRKSRIVGLVKDMTKTAAREAVAKIVSDSCSPRSGSNVPLFGLFVENVYWPFYSRKWKASTKMKNCVRVKAHLLYEFETRELGSFRRDELQDFLDSKGKTHSFTTVNNLRWDMKAIFDMAVAEGHIRINPAVMLFTPKTAAKPLHRVMSVREVRTVLAALDQRERLIAKLAIVGGMRPGEIFALTWGRVGEAVAEVTQRVYEGIIDTPKSERGKRKVGLADGLMVELEQYRLAVGGGAECFVFPSECGTPLGKNNVWNRYMAPKLRAVGMEWVNFQVMRRTFTTISKANGGDAKAIADQAGHDIGVSLREYVQTPIEVKLELVNKLEKILVG
jgi:integrase